MKVYIREGGYEQIMGKRFENCPRLPFVFLVDTSMSADHVGEAGETINSFIKWTSVHERAKAAFDMAVIEFGDEARVIREFSAVKDNIPIVLAPRQGETKLGAGINLAIDKAEERIRFYAGTGSFAFKPCIVLISDGRHTDDLSIAEWRIAEKCNDANGGFRFSAIVVSDCNLELLKALTNGKALMINEMRWDFLQDWLAPEYFMLGCSWWTEKEKYKDILIISG